MEILLALAITLAVEVNLFMLLDYKNLKLFILVSIINIVTNITMNVILLLANNDALYYIILSLFEGGVIFLEAFFVFLFLKYKYTRCLFFSLIANVTSFLVGLLINQFTLNETTKLILSISFLTVYFIGLTIFSIIASNEYLKRE